MLAKWSLRYRLIVEMETKDELARRHFVARLRNKSFVTWRNFVSDGKATVTNEQRAIQNDFRRLCKPVYSAWKMVSTIWKVENRLNYKVGLVDRFIFMNPV